MDEKIDFFPRGPTPRLDALLPLVGSCVSDALVRSARGAVPAFREASDTAPAPLAGMGFFRIGEDGRLYFTSKAEHHHLSLGHAFPSLRLLEHAGRFGTPNSMHNNTCGHITRPLEAKLVARRPTEASRENRTEIKGMLDSTALYVLNRVINLETGGLVVEAPLKMVLGRFLAFEKGQPAPRCAGRIPELLVMSDYKEGTAANYHGTTALTQVMRGCGRT